MRSSAEPAIWRNAALRTLLLGAALAGLAAGVAYAAVVTVDQKNLKFSVPQLVVAKGDSVIFLNSDDTSHNISIVGQGFSASSGLQSPGEPFRVQLMKTGAYQVTCRIHPRMRMTVIVK
jgi:plastocyanin